MLRLWLRILRLLARRELGTQEIADEIGGVGRRTIYRYLHALEDEGLVLRRERTQGTYGSGEAVVTYTIDERALLRALGLDVPRPRRARRTYRWQGRDYTASELAAKAGIALETMYARLRYHGWSVARAMLPVESSGRDHARLVAWRGERLTVGEWARRTGLTPGMIYMRLRCGWSVEKALSTPRKRAPNRAPQLRDEADGAAR